MIILVFSIFTTNRDHIPVLQNEHRLTRAPRLRTAPLNGGIITGYKKTVPEAAAGRPSERR
jgi:hypothetical protein